VIKLFWSRIKKKREGKSTSGFTLLEMVIVTGILGVVSVGAVGLLATGLRAQKSAGAVHEVLQNVWYAQDQLAQKFTFSPCRPFSSGGCESLPFLQLADGDYTEIRVENAEGQTMRYFRGSCLVASINSICEQNVDLGTTTALSSRSVEIDRLTFVLKGNDNDKQPKITVIIGARSALSSLQRIDVQATVSMRAITFE
jgi:prepilin-type N-terminal cleavage/methylation domain-containing protein